MCHQVVKFGLEFRVLLLPEFAEFSSLPTRLILAIIDPHIQPKLSLCIFFQVEIINRHRRDTFLIACEKIEMGFANGVRVRNIAVANF